MICMWKPKLATNTTHIYAYTPKRRRRKKLEKNKNGKEAWEKYAHATIQWPDTFTVIRNHQNRRGAFSFFSSSASFFVFLALLLFFLSFTLLEFHMQINAYNFIRHYVSTVMGWWILKETTLIGLLFLLFQFFFVMITVVVVISCVVFCWPTHTRSLSEFETCSFSGVFTHQKPIAIITYLMLTAVTHSDNNGCFESPSVIRRATRREITTFVVQMIDADRR